ncbi:FAD/FMN-containing dehydrogenase [Mycolicibacterium rutilum]|uniref:FAD/FMN-containing dehydrogenase n=1 Tax=Mycolicibacterium rutilum TaxID=370526 RepID=A0A1H6IZK7_MYCRU|nr:FAD-binding oxidoreductase [Mycolicibacterium rutilum]SEH53726.1 FAD/FMN-containing dehydrogenase [Mycolicibacterium rutilum]
MTILTDLRSAIAPDRVLVDGPEFDAALHQFNGAVHIRPAVVVRCESAPDVQVAIRVAREHTIPLSVRGGANDFWGRGLRSDGLVLDLSAMRAVRVDEDRRIATVEGGALSSDVVRAAEKAGLTAVTGTVGTVGIVGLTLGGGYGPLTGRFGLAADNLLGAQVVLADGALVDTDTEPDLLWASRGGGGNFGVVTSARIQLHPVPVVVSGTILYPVTQARSVLAGLHDILAGAPDELTVDVGFLPGADGSPTVYVAPTWSGDVRRGDAPGGPVHTLTRLGTPVLADIAPVARSVPLAATTAMFPFGRRGAIRTRMLPGISEPVGDVLERAARNFSSPFSALLLHQFHGAPTRVPLDATAFALREPHSMAELIALWDNDSRPADTVDTPHQRWLEHVHAALEPYAMPGGYVNLLGPESPDQIAQAYGANTARLLAIKRRFDPHGLFDATPLPPGCPE